MCIADFMFVYQSSFDVAGALGRCLRLAGASGPGARVVSVRESVKGGRAESDVRLRCLLGAPDGPGGTCAWLRVRLGQGIPCKRRRACLDSKEGVRTSALRPDGRAGASCRATYHCRSRTTTTVQGEIAGSLREIDAFTRRKRTRPLILDARYRAVLDTTHDAAEIALERRTHMGLPRAVQVVRHGWESLRDDPALIRLWIEKAR